MSSAISIHLSDVLGKLYAVHRRDEREFAKLTESQREECAARLGVARYFRNDAWEFAAAEVLKRAGISEGRLAEYAGRVNLGALHGLEDVAAPVAKLHDDAFTPILLAKLAEDYPDVVEATGVGIASKAKDSIPPAPAPADTSRADVASHADAPGLLTVKQAAKWANVAEKTIRRRIKDGRLRASPYGSGSKRKNYRIDPADLTALKPEADAESARALTIPRRRRQPTALLARDYLPRVG
jgi:excisionase family DNA binding protein